MVMDRNQSNVGDSNSGSRGRHPRLAVSRASSVSSVTRSASVSSNSRPPSVNIDGQRKVDPIESVNFMGMLLELETVWESLHFDPLAVVHLRERHRKTHAGNIESLRAVLSAWKIAAGAIKDREAFLNRLQMFEHTASDPRRFWRDGGDSTPRMREADRRAPLIKMLEEHNRRCREHCRRLKRRTGDVAMYRGKPYLKKMQMDHSEMLKQLERERLELAEYSYEEWLAQKKRKSEPSVITDS